MNTTQCIQILARHGYTANVSPVSSDVVIVQDPVHVRSGSGPLRIEHEPRAILARNVWRFIAERE
jgi:hypothetical protein